jgi:putative ABC transport system substrate-binding protein
MKGAFMKGIPAFLIGLLVLCLITPLYAADKMYRIEVLQVANIPVFDDCYEGFVKELANNGISVGKNLTINRKIIDFDIEKGGIWKKIGVAMDIKSEASRIASVKPDLAVTIGTPATKYAKDKIIGAGIPLVFTAVAFPQAAGCKSLTEAGPGFTGATLYMNVKDALRIVRLGFPNVKTLGVIYSDDENAVAHADEIKKQGPPLGFTVLTKEVSKNDPIIPASQELLNKGVQAFIVPLDTYYSIKGGKASVEHAAFARKNKIPNISFALSRENRSGALYIGSEFSVVGSLAAKQAANILLNGVKPESLPIARQQDLTILVDEKQFVALGIQLPMEILKLAKPIQ